MTEVKAQKFLEDTEYFPGWLKAEGFDLKEVTKELESIGVIDREEAHMRYRGTVLPRSKFFLVDSLVEVPVYNYPGFQYGSVVNEYEEFSKYPVVLKLKEVIEAKFGVKLTQAIGTLYQDEKDNIGFHNDKVASLDEKCPIFTLSFLERRPLALRPNGSKEVTCEVPMEPGSLLVLGPVTNKNNQHAILPATKKLGKRISLIFRCVKKRMPMELIRKKAAVTERRRGERKEG